MAARKPVPNKKGPPKAKAPATPRPATPRPYGGPSRTDVTFNIVIAVTWLIVIGALSYAYTFTCKGDFIWSFAKAIFTWIVAGIAILGLSYPFEYWGKNSKARDEANGVFGANYPSLKVASYLNPLTSKTGKLLHLGIALALGLYHTHTCQAAGGSSSLFQTQTPSSVVESQTIEEE